MSITTGCYLRKWTVFTALTLAETRNIFAMSQGGLFSNWEKNINVPAFTSFFLHQTIIQ